MKKIAVILIFIFSLKATAQYNGGAGDGFAYDGTAQTTLTNTDLSVAYNGGGGDGFAFSSLAQTTLNNTDLSVAYNGGAGDGFAFSSLAQTTLNNTDLSILYQGGAGDGFDTNIADPVILDDFPRIKLAINVILQGATFNPNPGENNLMRDNLRINNYLPTTSPYGDGTTCQADVFNTGGSNGNGLSNDDIVDWVFVELRNFSDASSIDSSKSALLQRDGDVVDIDGVSDLVIPFTPGEYYVAIRHRNHLGVMTASSTFLSQETRDANFISSNFNTYGSNARVSLGNGKMALWTGDVNSDKSLKFSGSNNDTNAIKDSILSDPLNVLNFITFSSSGYLNGDIDLNGTARFSGAPNDSNPIKDNILSHPGNFLGLSTFIITEQLPNN
ncbi:hemagglutinin protein [uncultured Psychroserpens sp.]|uniref:hemagglutinin protein n=1 Tax=uncultured Psychroserpens sp. TaxID=255436 RepID=UPI00260B39FE|nr:hemagglutinin protein [uncultured Psychroserpens sp.]